MLEIRIPEASAWRQRLVLDGAAYFLVATYNVRVDRWFFSLADANQEAVVEGRMVLCNRNLLRRLSTFNGPPGKLVAVDLSKQNQPPTRANFGKTVGLFYLSAGETL
jgi:hypothetical protein